MNTFNELMYQIDGEETFESELYNSLFTDNYYIEKEVKQNLTPEQQLEELEKRNKRLKKIIIAAIAICGAIIAALIIINKKKSKEKELKNKELGKSRGEYLRSGGDAKDRCLQANDNLKKSQKEADNPKAEISELKQKSADITTDKNKTPEEKKEEKEKSSQEMKDTVSQLTSALLNVKKLQERKERVKKHEDEVRRDLEQKKYELKNKNRKQRPNTLNAWGEKYSGTIKKEKKRFNAYLSQIKSADATITTLKAKLAECEKIKDETERT